MFTMVESSTTISWAMPSTARPSQRWSRGGAPTGAGEEVMGRPSAAGCGWRSTLDAPTIVTRKRMSGIRLQA
jgi:hypothetical protein